MVYVGVHMFMCLKEELAWATGKQHWVIGIVINMWPACENLPSEHKDGRFC